MLEKLSGDDPRKQQVIDVIIDIREAGEFTVTNAHLALLQRASVAWCGLEFGTPCIDPNRPYGNSGVLEDIAEITDPGVYGACKAAGVGPWLEYLDEHEDRLRQLHAETTIALQIALATGQFRAGRHILINHRWQYVAAGK